MASNRKFRIVRIATLDAFGRTVEWYAAQRRVATLDAFGRTVEWYAAQRRVAFFWWVTVEHFGQLTQARYWLHKSGAPQRPERVIKVVE